MRTALSTDSGRLPRAAYRLARRVDNISLKLLDFGTASAAWILAYLAAVARVPVPHRGREIVLVALAVVIQCVVNRIAGLYGPVWRYASVEEAVRVVLAVVAGTATSTAALAIASAVTSTNLPVFTMSPVAALLLLLGCGGIRFQSRLFAVERLQEQGPERVRALIIGAGAAGATLAFELNQTDLGNDVRVVGFVDDDPALRGRSVRGVRVLGSTGDLDTICRAQHIDRLFIALPDPRSEHGKDVVTRALKTSAQVKVLPLARERVRGPLLRSLRDLDVTDLLGREHAPVDSAEIAHYLRGATVLVTGAGGSIGSEIARQIARYEPGRLLLLDRDESLLHDVAVGPLADADVVLLDLRDRRRLRALFERYGPDVVFHAAAHKHVPLLERHPIEAVRTNVLGTWSLARAAAELGCRRFVHISTDKAADPCSVMGATKRAAEQVVFEVGRRYDLPFVAVRFGNVLGSRGSVVPTFLRQILDGGPVTVTSPQMTRYFMTIPEAVSLVLQSGAMAAEGRIFLLDMGEPVSILHLAREMIRLAGLRPDHDIDITITGARPGERLHERLHDDAEILGQSGHPSIASLVPKVMWNWSELVTFLRQLEACCENSLDGQVTALLEEMLRRGGVECQLTRPPSAPVPRRVEAAVDGNAIIDLTRTEPAGGRGGAGGDAVDDLDRPPRRPAPRRRGPLLLGGAPSFTPPLSFARPTRPPLERVLKRARPSYDRGILTNGPLVREFEERIGARLGVSHAIAVSSCTTGLMLTLQALVDGRPGPVVVPSFTFSATAHAVAWNGRMPRFVENDPSSFQMDLGHASALLEGASAMLPIHMFGAPCSPASVQELARAEGIPVLFDAAHAVGATSVGRPVGGFGDAEVFSLTPTKVLVAGEGGVVLTSDEGLADRVRVGRDYGDPGDDDPRFVGLNARMSEFHAAMALESLSILDVSLERRRRLALRYRRALEGVPGITCQAVPDTDESTYKDFTVAVDGDRFGLTRDDLVAFLAVEGIETRTYFDPPVHRQHAYRGSAPTELPVTEATSASVVSLPIYPDLADHEVERVIAVIVAAHDHADAVAAGLREHFGGVPHDAAGGKAGRPSG